jgi:threonine dehydrogenase-like Zn-dependent dehydrogenase
MKEALLKATDGRGADAVLEVVGNSAALITAIEMVRPWGQSRLRIICRAYVVAGAVSSCGVHIQEFNFNVALLYNKNLKLRAFFHWPLNSCLS